MFAKKKISEIALEETSHAVGSRKVIVGKEETTSLFFEAHTYGYLPPSGVWTMHKHENIVEICVVFKGSGKIRDLQGNEETFEPGDRFIFPSDVEHAIENTSSELAEFYFFRFKNM